MSNQLQYTWYDEQGRRKFIKPWHNFIYSEDEFYLQSTALEWLKKYYRGDIDNVTEQLVFENPQDLTYFLLRWS